MVLSSEKRQKQLAVEALLNNQTLGIGHSKRSQLVESTSTDRRAAPRRDRNLFICLSISFWLQNNGNVNDGFLICPDTQRVSKLHYYEKLNRFLNSYSVTVQQISS